MRPLSRYVLLAHFDTGQNITVKFQTVNLNLFTSTEKELLIAYVLKRNMAKLEVSTLEKEKVSVCIFECRTKDEQQKTYTRVRQLAGHFLLN